jgi:hypothetical protein
MPKSSLCGEPSFRNVALITEPCASQWRKWHYLIPVAMIHGGKTITLDVAKYRSEGSD